MTRYLALCLTVLVLMSVSADAGQHIKRSSAVRRAFLTQHGLTRTPKGCQVDHIQPLSCGGADALSNLQLLCGEALRQKERTERQCRR